jgi:hypothetical protein
MSSKLSTDSFIFDYFRRIIRILNKKNSYTETKVNNIYLKIQFLAKKKNSVINFLIRHLSPDMRIDRYNATAYPNEFFVRNRR